MGDADEAAADVARREEQRVDQAGIPGLEWTYSDKSELENKVAYRVIALVTSLLILMT